MVKSLDEVIERLQYKADNIRAKLEPSYFTECIDYLKTLPREESGIDVDALIEAIENNEDMPTVLGYTPKEYEAYLCGIEMEKGIVCEIIDKMVDMKGE